MDDMGGVETFQLGSVELGTDTYAHLAATLTAAGANLGYSADVNSTTGILEINQLANAAATTQVTAATSATVTANGGAPTKGVAGLTDTINAGTALAGKLTITDGYNGSEVFNLGLPGVTDTLAELAATINTVGTTGGANGASLGYSADINSSGNLEIQQTAGTTFTHVVTAVSAAAVTAYAQTAASDTVASGASSTSSGVATMSYTDKAGATLSGTDLSTQQDAESALTSLNSAIADVAAQDGYIGAQINTLDAVSSVLSTQSENVQSAQNAVQATDYAQASSNMSKYEILSQTGIAALAQANSQQQDVLKLLQ
jgi:flagellin